MNKQLKIGINAVQKNSWQIKTNRMEVC